MHYANKFTPPKTEHVDIDRELRTFGMPRRELTAAESKAPPCLALMGKDDLRVMRERRFNEAYAR